jgi:AraC-like DNA-binding protein
MRRYCGGAKQRIAGPTAAVIFTELPDLPPRPQTGANAAFRRRFYERWGTENCVISGHARHAEYAALRQTLSIKCVSGGAEHYFVGRRDVPVSDGTWLVLNSGREYGSLLRADATAYTFSLFFRPGLAEEVAATCGDDPDRVLDRGGQCAPASPAFHEQLRPHDQSLTPAIRQIQRAVALGERDEQWLEEQFTLLAGGLIRAEHRQQRFRERALAHLRPATRGELSRRLLVAEAFMREHLAEPLPLRVIARQACLSPYHLLRRFRELHGTTPTVWLRRLRTQRALRLRRDRALSLQEIAVETGISRASLWRAMRGREPLRPELCLNALAAVAGDADPLADDSVRRTAAPRSCRCRRNTPTTAARRHR